jgi:hypothetical protein
MAYWCNQFFIRMGQLSNWFTKKTVDVGNKSTFQLELDFESKIKYISLS